MTRWTPCPECGEPVDLTHEGWLDCQSCHGRFLWLDEDDEHDDYDGQYDHRFP